jgi:hypothetical protein
VAGFELAVGVVAEFELAGVVGTEFEFVALGVGVVAGFELAVGVAEPEFGIVAGPPVAKGTVAILTS